MISYFKWFWDFLYFIGLYRKAKFMIIGLDNAGKSTLLTLLRYGKLRQHSPTPLPVSEEMTMAGITFTAYDLGGHMHARRLWKEYMPAIDAIVFVIDASDKDRILEAKVELQGLLVSELSADIPIVILGNKTDKKDAYGRDDLINILELHATLSQNNKYPVHQLDTDSSSQQRRCELFMCSLLHKQGYGDAFRWMAKNLKNS